MTQEGWRAIVLMAAREHAAGDDEPLDLLTRLLEEQDDARQVLRDKGYGWLGLNWLKTVELVPATDVRAESQKP